MPITTPSITVQPARIPTSSHQIFRSPLYRLRKEFVGLPVWAPKYGLSRIVEVLALTRHIEER
jgi:hypothetical protein